MGSTATQTTLCLTGAVAVSIPASAVSLELCTTNRPTTQIPARASSEKTNKRGTHEGMWGFARTCALPVYIYICIHELQPTFPDISWAWVPSRGYIRDYTKLPKKPWGLWRLGFSMRHSIGCELHEAPSNL